MKERVGSTAAAFESAAELREVLERLLTALEADSEAGSRLRSSRVPHRFVFTDQDLVLNVAAADDDVHFLRWEFSDEIDWTPALTLEMDSAIANRYLQGEENLAIAVARRRINVSCKTRAALSFLPMSRELITTYSGLVEREYPHLALG